MSKSQELEVGTTFTFNDTVAESTLSHVGAVLGGFMGEVALQAKLAVFDQMNSTNLRSQRNELMRVKRISDMAHRAGMIVINEK